MPDKKNARSLGRAAGESEQSPEHSPLTARCASCGVIAPIASTARTTHLPTGRRFLVPVCFQCVRLARASIRGRDLVVDALAAYMSRLAQADDVVRGLLDPDRAE